MAVRTILILEDDPASAGLYASALGGAGYEPITTTGFEEARKYLKEHLPDALLTDVRVAEYNGLQLALLFRSLSPAGPILVVSGHDDSVIRKEATNVGAQFLLKPVDVDQLIAYFSSVQD